MSEFIFTSVLICSRKRPELLSKNLSLLYELSSYPNNMECLIRVDDDDHGTVEEYKNGSFFKSHRELVKMYTGPRIGYKYLTLMQKQIYKLSKGDLIVPFADDCRPVLEGWDAICLPYKKKCRMLACNLRLILTRQAIERYEIFRDFGGIDPVSKKPRKKKGRKFPSIDNVMCDFAQQNGMYIPIPNWYDKVQPKDKVLYQGRFRGWKLEDLSILDNLLLKEVEI